MGNLLSFSKTMEENMKKNQEFMAEMNKITVSNMRCIIVSVNDCVYMSAAGLVKRPMSPFQMCHLIALKIHFKIILPPMPGLCKLCFLSGLATETLFIYFVTCVLYRVTTCPDFCRTLLKLLNIPHPETGLNVPQSAK
jgi:hypothetical protein